MYDNDRRLTAHEFSTLVRPHRGEADRGTGSTRNGLFIPDSAKEKPQQGEVIAVGHGKMLQSGELMALDVKVGDRVLFGKYSGTETKLTGTEYIIMREDDVLGIIESAVATEHVTTQVEKKE